MYQFTNENQREFGLGNEVIISDGSPFEIKNEKLANSLLSRGIIKMVAEMGKEIVKKAATDAIDKVVEKATEKITKK